MALPLSNSHQSAFGCVLMSPRPSWGGGKLTAFGSRWKCQRPFRAAIRYQPYGSPDLLHETPHQAKAVPLARLGLDKADAIIANRQDRAGRSLREMHANCSCALRKRVKIC